jgi:hypothetical protein
MMLGRSRGMVGWCSQRVCLRGKRSCGNAGSLEKISARKLGHRLLTFLLSGREEFSVGA